MNFEESQRCFRIMIINDSITEGEETFTLQLSDSPQNSIQSIFIESTTVVNIREVCYDEEIRLRGGFDENQGRVEICYGGVWGTVCDDVGWGDGGRANAQVFCAELGLALPGISFKLCVNHHLLCTDLMVIHHCMFVF